MDYFRAMRVFTRVAEEGSLTTAGRSLGLSLSSVSRELARLEEHLATPLFLRTTRKLMLTGQGELFYSSSKQIMENLRAAELALAPSAEVAGHLHVSAPALLGRHLLSPLLPEYLQRFPKVQVDLTLTDHPVNLIDERLDVAIRIGTLGDSSLISRRLGEVQMVTCASSAYLARCGEPQSPPDLKRHDCLVFATDPNDGLWRYQSPARRLTVRVGVRFRANALEAVVGAALAGSGVARLPQWYIVEHLQSGALHRILQPFERPPSPIQALFLASRAHLPVVRSFIAFLAEELKIPAMS